MMAATLTPVSVLAENMKKSFKEHQILSKRYEELLTTEKYCDCVFLVGEFDKFKCHKLILASASPVFEAMFYGPLSEKQDFIEILDMSPKIFQILILYIYKGSMQSRNLSLDETIELYYGAEKYFLNYLKSECLADIETKLRFSNILTSLELSICLDLQNLLHICMNFFTRCCLGESQFVSCLEKNYYHVTKDCIKTIISLCKGKVPSKDLLWFICKWCQEECIETGIKSSECTAMIEDLNLTEPVDSVSIQDRLKPQYMQLITRCYYKACRPFNIDYKNFTWLSYITSNRFISLQGLIIRSRLPPPLSRASECYHYIENFCIEITAPQHDPSLQWSYKVNKELQVYICDLSIKWSKGVVLSPNVEYQIKLIWSPDQSQGAQYSCGLFSSLVDGIEFRDLDSHCGSLIEGIHFINLS